MAQFRGYCTAARVSAQGDEPLLWLGEVAQYLEHVLPVFTLGDDLLDHGPPTGIPCSFAKPDLSQKRTPDNALIRAGQLLVNSLCFLCERTADTPKLPQGLGSGHTRFQPLPDAGKRQLKQRKRTLSSLGIGNHQVDCRLIKGKASAACRLCDSAAKFPLAHRRNEKSPTRDSV